MNFYEPKIGFKSNIDAHIQQADTTTQMTDFGFRLNRIKVLCLSLILAALLAAPPVAGQNSAGQNSEAAMQSPGGSDAPAMQDIHDIKPALAPGADLQWVLWAAAALIVIALAALAWWWWRKRRLGPQVEAPVPELPPHTLALAQLDELAGSDCLEGKLFYFRLSAILRGYMEKMYAFPAAEMTTEELMPRIGRLPLSPDLAGLLQAFCRATDPVKFAGAPADTGRMAADLAFVRRFVHETTSRVHEDNHNCVHHHDQH